MFANSTRETVPFFSLFFTPPPFFLVGGGSGIWTQGFVLAKALYHLSQNSSPRLCLSILFSFTPHVALVPQDSTPEFVSWCQARESVCGRKIPGSQSHTGVAGNTLHKQVPVSQPARTWAPAHWLIAQKLQCVWPLQCPHTRRGQQGG
jgi:hypothetical protein